MRNLPVRIFNYLRVFNMLRKCCGVRVLPEEPFFQAVTNPHLPITCRLRGMQRQLHDLAVCLAHVRRCRIPVNVHGCANVCVPHELLLNSDWSAD